MNKVINKCKAIYFPSDLMNGENNRAVFLLVVLIVIDCFFLFLHVSKEFFPVISSDLFSITKDQALPEVFQYLKLISIVFLLLMLSRNLNDWAYKSWAILFAYLLVDDAFSVHENFGLFIANSFQLSTYFGLRPQDSGELMVTIFFASIILSVIFFFYVKGTNQFRDFSKALVLLLVVLGFFGVIVDMLVIVQKFGSKTDFLLSMIEDGGEMFVISIMAYYIFSLKNMHTCSKRAYE